MKMGARQAQQWRWARDGRNNGDGGSIGATKKMGVRPAQQ